MKLRPLVSLILFGLLPPSIYAGTISTLTEGAIP
jgi:hypothetical protein